MNFIETKLAGAYVVEFSPHVDERGQFARMWCREEFTKHGLTDDLVQGNVSVNPYRGTVRGLHYQVPPYAEAKLVRCVRGSIFDVFVDVRPRSPTFLQWVGVELVAGDLRMAYVPEGFAHGFQTLEDDCEVNYLVSAPFAPAAGRGIRPDDPAVGVRWPLPIGQISPKDKSWPLLPKNAAAERSIDALAPAE